MPLASRVSRFLVVSLLVLAARDRAARADDGDGPPSSHLHGVLGVARSIGEPQSHELGWGGVAGATYEIRFARMFGLQAGVEAIELTAGDPPVDPRFAPRSQGFSFDAAGGFRLTPFGSSSRTGPWLDAGVGVALTASVVRPLVNAHLGWDVVSIGGVGLGPFVGYAQVFQSGDALRPEDAHVLSAGIAVDLGAAPAARVKTDRDHDSVTDDVDACPDVPGVPSTNAASNGCPPPRADRDGDAVFDDEDACPDTPGVRTSDPKTNGCPAIVDRDHDGINDPVDACPDVPGVATDDPKTNGCPRPPDRDKDGVIDSDDACPDVPGVHTDDPKTNGCPAATELVRVEGDQILLGDVIHFDTGSPHIHHVSYPLVQKLAKYFEDTPDIEEVDIEGHADETGKSDYNLYLSRERAASVKRLLVKFGVAPEKLTTHAYGETRPRDPGHDERARRENRRVEFTITRAREGTSPAQPSAPSPKHEGGR